MSWVLAACMLWIAWELRQLRLQSKHSGIEALTKSTRQVAYLYSRYLRKYYPNVIKTSEKGGIQPGTDYNSASVVEMTPEKFSELRYRVRMTPNEAAAAYEARALKQAEEAKRASN